MMHIVQPGIFWNNQFILRRWCAIDDEAAEMSHQHTVLRPFQSFQLLLFSWVQVQIQSLNPGFDQS
jgi:hypothetical protein